MATADIFGSELLDRVEHWSWWLALGVAAIGSFFMADIRFGVSVLLGAAFDITMLHLMRARTPKEGDTGVESSFGLLFIGRLGGKAALVVLAYAVPAAFNIWGMAAGVLVVEFALVTVGAVSAAMRAFGNGHSA